MTPEEKDRRRLSFRWRGWLPLSLVTREANSSGAQHFSVQTQLGQLQFCWVLRTVCHTLVTRLSHACHTCKTSCEDSHPHTPRYPAHASVGTWLALCLWFFTLFLLGLKMSPFARIKPDSFLLSNMISTWSLQWSHFIFIALCVVMCTYIFSELIFLPRVKLGTTQIYVFI